MMPKTPKNVLKVLKRSEDEGVMEIEDDLREFVEGERRLYENPDTPFFSRLFANHYPTLTSWMANKLSCTFREADIIIRWADAAEKPKLPNNEPLNRTNVVSLTLPLRARPGLNSPASTAINIKGL